MSQLKWWQTAVFYQIYPRSFANGNGDGIGDFKGIMEKLDYLSDLGIDAIWLSPHFPSPNWDCGYDISDYMDVAPEYGTLDDFKTFLAESTPWIWTWTLSSTQIIVLSGKMRMTIKEQWSTA